MLFVARDYDGSLEQVSALLEKDPKNIDALLLRGGMKSVKGDIDGLLEDVDAALAANPKHEGALALKAQALGRKGDVAGAEEALRKLVEAKPAAANHTEPRALPRDHREERRGVEGDGDRDLRGRDSRGSHRRPAVPDQLLHEPGSERQSRADAAAGARRRPTDGNVLLTLARFYYMTGKADKAEEMLEASVQAKPDSVDPLLVLADYHRRATRWTRRSATSTARSRSTRRASPRACAAPS